MVYISFNSIIEFLRQFTLQNILDNIIKDYFILFYFEVYIYITEKLLWL